MRTEEQRTVPAVAAWVIRLVRPADQSDLEFHFVNLRVDPKPIVWSRSTRPSPPSSAPSSAVSTRSRTRRSSVTRRPTPLWLIAAPPPAGRSSTSLAGRYTVAALLRMVHEALLLDGADPRSKPATGPPSDDVTALEMPKSSCCRRSCCSGVRPRPPHAPTAMSQRCGRFVSEPMRSHRGTGHPQPPRRRRQ